MRRREFAWFGCGVLAVWPLGLRAENVGKTARVGFLLTASVDSVAHLVKAFELSLENLGYVLGKDIVIEYRSAQGVPDRLQELAAELVRLGVDVIVTTTNPSIAAAAKATASIPIVFAAAAGPVENGFVVSLARPGKNLTGLSYDAAPEAVAKTIELLREISPTASRIAMIRYRGIGNYERWYEEAHQAARALKLEIESHEARDIGEIDRAFPRIFQQRPDALLVIPSALTFERRREIAAFALRERLPSASGFAEYAREGGLISFGPDVKDLYRRVAIYVDKILKGVNPSELPVEQPIKFELVVNLRTAKAIGITVAPRLLARADEVIE